MHLDIDHLHHAYLIIGDREMHKKALLDYLEKEMNVVIAGNPDLSIFDFSTLVIDDARNLALLQLRKTVDEQVGKKFFIITCTNATEEAQNALLKVFEEPTADTHFFIIAEQNNFLPTFLSRLDILERKDHHSQKTVISSDLDDRLLAMQLPERLASVAALSADIADEKVERQAAIDFVNAIEKELFHDSLSHASALRACEDARHALMSRGAMIKMILENLMLQL